MAVCPGGPVLTRNTKDRFRQEWRQFNPKSKIKPKRRKGRSQRPRKGKTDVSIRKFIPINQHYPDEMNKHIRTINVAPMTTGGKNYPTRVPCVLQRKKGQIVLDQIRTTDQSRLINRLGTLDAKTQLEVINVLQQLFIAAT